ncbi:putative metal-binding motif-containing protein [Zobellia uliginosa]|uniref:putative metal-binding motif-containing protein n=1 Tax=Zobellia uliginosa TaxID=143224 RepID=UPI0026E38223|nr:putative metal-binding motif-containing protein [Zobellia uliginosa]MDO6516099.1 putative metal-binding motif-containing protein [Zobellia uliginosa]
MHIQKTTYLAAFVIMGMLFINSCAEDDTCTEQTWYQDADNDGFGNASNSQLACTQPTGYVADNTDFDDNNATAYPGANELCNGIDDNGNGTIDENLTVCGEGKICENGACVTATTYYKDKDGDLFGDPNDSIIAGTTIPENYVTNNTDCDDTDASTYPGAEENLLDLVDNNCNGEVDELNVIGENWFFQRHESTSCSDIEYLEGGNPFQFRFLADNTVSFTEPGSLSASSYNITGTNLTLEMVYVTQVRTYKFVGNYVYSENDEKFSGSFIYTAYNGFTTDSEVLWTCEGPTDVFK